MTETHGNYHLVHDNDTHIQDSQPKCNSLGMDAPDWCQGYSADGEENCNKAMGLMCVRDSPASADGIPPQNNILIVNGTAVRPIGEDGVLKLLSVLYRNMAPTMWARATTVARFQSKSAARAPLHSAAD